MWLLSFYQKELVKEFEGAFNYLGESTEKYKTFTVLITKEQKKLKGLVKMEKLQKSYITNYNLPIAQDLQQACYQMLLINLLKEFIKLNVNMDTMIKKLKLLELNAKTVSSVLNTQTLKMI